MAAAQIHMEQLQVGRQPLLRNGTIPGGSAAARSALTPPPARHTLSPRGFNPPIGVPIAPAARVGDASLRLSAAPVSAMTPILSQAASIPAGAMMPALGYASTVPGGSLRMSVRPLARAMTPPQATRALGGSLRMSVVPATSAPQVLQVSSAPGQVMRMPSTPNFVTRQVAVPTATPGAAPAPAWPVNNAPAVAALTQLTQPALSVEGSRVARSLTPKREALMAAPCHMQTGGHGRLSRSPSPVGSPRGRVQSPDGPMQAGVMTAPPLMRPQAGGRVSPSPSPVSIAVLRVPSPLGSASPLWTLPDTTPALPLPQAGGSPRPSPYAAAALQPLAAWDLAATSPSALPLASYPGFPRGQLPTVLGPMMLAPPMGTRDLQGNTPEFLRPADTVQFGTGELSYNSSPPPSWAMLPFGITSHEAAPGTAPASPSLLGRRPPSPLLPLSLPVQPVPMVMQQRLGPLPHPDPGMLPLDVNTNLAQEVAVRDVELHVLREEVASRELEAADLRERLKDAGAKLQDASGDVDTMSVKVETLAGNRHAVLKASCTQYSDKVHALHKRLAQSEVELGEKDYEIQVLRQAVTEDQQYVQFQKEELGDLHMGQQEQGEKARWLEQHQHGLRRKAALDVWHEGVQAQLEQERGDLAAQRQRQAACEQMEQLSKESASIASFICGLERKHHEYVQGIQEMKKTYDNMVMEARLSESASKIGQETAFEQTQSQLAELQGLEAQLAQATVRKSRSLGASQAYSQHENVAMRHMNELISLTECMRDITGLLREGGLSMHKDPTQRAVDEEVMLLHHIEDFKMASPGPVFASHGLRPPMSGAGRSRSASPGPAGREEMMAFSSPGPMGRPRLPSTPRSRSPIASGPPMGMLPDSGALGPRSWGMPALVAPISIGGAM